MDSAKFDLKAIFLNYHSIPNCFKIKHGINLDLWYYEGIPDKYGIRCF